MSQVAISGNASGTGVFTVASPNSNSNYTLTLPTQTGTLATTTDITNATTGATASTSDITGVNTTATVTSGTTAMTVGSATNIVAGMYVVAQGITPGTTVSSISGTSVTLSANANATLSSAPVTFYSVAKLVTPGSIGGQTCRAWVNFNGVTTVTYRAAYNVSSVTRNGTGDYTVNFTTAMPDVNYVTAGFVATNQDSFTSNLPLMGIRQTTATSYYLAGSLRFNTGVNGAVYDAVICTLVIFR